MKALGKKVKTPSQPNYKILEVFPNPGVDIVTFETEEFTSLCPVTGQPDFVKVKIRYNPKDLCIESKSLKLYLQSYRNEKGFIEQMTMRILEDLKRVLNPNYVDVCLTSSPRGGIILKAEVSIA